MNCVLFVGAARVCCFLIGAVACSLLFDVFSCGGGCLLVGVNCLLFAGRCVLSMVLLKICRVLCVAC